MNTLATGKIFVFTGKLTVTRNQASEAVRKAGGFVSTSVTQNVDYVTVGSKPGSKEARAIVLGVPRITEEELLEMLKELPEEELPIEKWAEHNIKIITEESLLSLLEILETQVKEAKKETVYLPREEMSYEDMSTLSQLLADHAELVSDINIQPIICRHCDKIIPYSIHNGYYYCFNCHCYEDVKLHVCQWGPCNDLPSTPDTWYEECTRCETVRPMTKSKLAERSKVDLKSDFVHSIEFASNVIRKVAVLRENRSNPPENSELINSIRYTSFVQFLKGRGISVNPKVCV